jgi:hypothetical protein
LLDGATPPFGEVNSLATQKLLEVVQWKIASLACSAPTIELTDIVEQCATCIRETIPPSSQGYLPYATIVLFKFNINKVEYLLLGDSYLVLENGEMTEVAVDNRQKAFAVTERQAVRALAAAGFGPKSDEYRDAHLRLVQEEARWLNVDDGYWLLSNEPRAARQAISGTMALGSEYHVSAFSDGLARLATHLPIPIPVQDIPKSVRLFGPLALLQQLRAAECGFARQKGLSSSQHDDAAMVMVSGCA